MWAGSHSTVGAENAGGGLCGPAKCPQRETDHSHPISYDYGMFVKKSLKKHALVSIAGIKNTTIN